MIQKLLELFGLKAKAAYAGKSGGGAAETYSDLEPKSQNQIDLENRFNGIYNQALSGFTSPIGGPNNQTPTYGAPQAMAPGWSPGMNYAPGGPGAGSVQPPKTVGDIHALTEGDGAGAGFGKVYATGYRPAPNISTDVSDLNNPYGAYGTSQAGYNVPTNGNGYGGYGGTGNAAKRMGVMSADAGGEGASPADGGAGYGDNAGPNNGDGNNNSGSNGGINDGGWSGEGSDNHPGNGGPEMYDPYPERLNPLKPVPEQPSGAKPPNYNDQLPLAQNPSIGWAGAPNMYDDSTMLGQLLNNAAQQQYAGNQRYNELGQQNEYLTGRRDDALSRSETAGDWYYDQAKGSYTSGLDTLDQARNSGKEYMDRAMTDYDNASRVLGDSEGYFANAGRVLGDAENAFRGGYNTLEEAKHIGDPWYDMARDAYGRANDMLTDQTGALQAGKDINEWYDLEARDSISNVKNMLKTGQISQPLEDAFMDTINRGLKNSMGTMINDLAGRGVLNSSVTNSGLSNLSQKAADAYNDNYLNNFSTVAGLWNDNVGQIADAGNKLADSQFNLATGYNNGANTAVNLGNGLSATANNRTNEYINIGNGMTGVGNGLNGTANAYTNAGNGLVGAAGGYTQNANGISTAGNNYMGRLTDIGNAYMSGGNSLMGAGSTAIGDQLAIAGGYGNAQKGNLAEQEQLMKDIPNYWDNAFSGLGPMQDWLKYLQDSRAPQTTVVG